MLKSMKSIMCALLLQGCTFNGIPKPTLASDVKTENVEMLFIGVPYMFAVQGSKVRLDDEWYVTSQHNKLIIDGQGKDVYYHPTCDIALVNETGDGETELANLLKNEKIQFVGYPLLFPVISVNHGKHISDFDIIGGVYDDCNAFEISTTTTMSGMSGGGVFNSSEGLVGVISGKINLPMKVSGGEYDGQIVEDVSYFVNLHKVRGWLKEITGNDYFPEM